MKYGETLFAIPLAIAAMTALSACNSTGSNSAPVTAAAGAAPAAGAVVLAGDRFSPSFIHAHLKVRRTTVGEVLALYGPPASRDNVASPSGDRSVMTYIRPEAVKSGVGETLGVIASLTPLGSSAGEALYRAGSAVDGVETIAAASAAQSAKARGAGNRLELIFVNDRLADWHLL
ncbi:hypothetical protein MKK69_16750 [Methylobacterium sp. J-026]|uniref:hypothetical protein n=1 Tax=Methylobacterium sp. J-026 TaxID=2836624 RepID=UPI001FBB7F64|nr:hypothetical protein [Methylobacterium sp. J-026]MCJ2135683.1 hypothetical protein [Methylobacterium sp. J-026]